jgi:hypothetical protein
MSIPLDRLYHYIESVAKEIYKGDVIIYRFFPHGSKNINDLNSISPLTWADKSISLAVICYDQEPLHWELYNVLPNFTTTKWNKTLTDNSLLPWCPNNLCNIYNIYDQNILLHSEQRSSQCDLYQENNFILAYYWSHAIISLDWYRFAKYINQKKCVKKTFLIYNRAWSGTREYRLKFLESIINAKLEKYCQTTMTSVESESNLHYSLHTFKNPIWQPTLQLEKYFLSNQTTSCYSADFVLEDYENTNIEVVLETLFDDDRLHLTEKSLRPIACGQPFILTATHGSLEYLRSYGFKTYHSVWNEEYDQIKDPKDRLNAIIELMRTIAGWDSTTQQNKMIQAQQIAEYNKQYFFSEEFFKLVSNELKQNLSSAITLAHSTNTAQVWRTRRKEIGKVDTIRDILSGRVPHPDFDSDPKHFNTITRKSIAKVMAAAINFSKKKSSTHS